MSRTSRNSGVIPIRDIADSSGADHITQDVNEEEEEENTGLDENELNDTGDNSDDASEGSELLARALPDRVTRGKRIQALIGEAADQDQQFWGHTTWVEENEDEEWSTEDEDHYRDVIDSDFDETESEENLESETEEQRALDLEAKRDNKAKAKQYHDPRLVAQRKFAQGIQKSTAKKLAAPRPTGVLGISRPLPPAAAKPKALLESTLGVSTSEKRIDKKRSRSRVLAQEDHLAIAAKVELENTKHLNAMIDHENWKRAMKEQKQSGTIWNGPMELLISWSSDRLIETEKKDISEQPGVDEDIHCREMLFFVDFDNPMSSSIPSMYSNVSNRKRRERHCSIYPDKLARYRDSMTGEYYSDAAAFWELRRRYQQESVSRVTNRLKSIDAKLKNLLRYLSTNSLLPFFEAEAPNVSLEMSPVMEEVKLNDYEKTPSEPAATSPSTSDDERRRVEIPATSAALVREKKKRLKRTPEAPLPSPKRPKYEECNLDIPVDQELVHPASESGNIDRQARKTVRKRSQAGILETAFINGEEVRAIPVEAAEHSYPTHQAHIPPYGIRRQPLRIRSTANTFCQQPGMPGFGLFADPFVVAAAAASPFASPLLLGSRNLPYISAPPGNLPGLPGAVDPLTLFSMTSGYTSPYAVGPEGFPAFFSPDPNPVMPDPFCMSNQNQFRQMSIPISSAISIGPMMGYANSPQQQQGCSLRDGVPAWSHEGIADPTSHSESTATFFSDNAASSSPGSSTVVSSVYCYPSPSNLHLSPPSSIPRSNASQMESANLVGMLSQPLDSSRTGMPLLGPPVYPTGIGWPPPAPVQQMNQAHAGVVLRPALSRD